MLSEIINKIETTSLLKQKLFEQVSSFFTELEKTCREVAVALQKESHEVPIPVKIEKINDYEFLFRVGGDVLVFILQSNIVRLSDDAYISKSKYLKDDVTLRYFGQILVYNFLADTLTYGRLDDPGYLITRILINRENHFFLEGDRKIVFEFPELKENPITKEKNKKLIENLLLSALNNDLLAPNFNDIMLISYHQKLEHTSSMGNPKKIGFDFFAKNRE
ncbi:hypothetical protein Belba_0520 [Belliella baltica DSM 15883]|uniref:Uncharacterized protein n=1 Tax=Belliella baltica (strain DSM 15883 / CIP 108006 / LMG 21964 / BA134) TaxID=866536 RepID=I3Z1R0_BELBD|nr:hypothetical protein [Belliella baltica]AFL83178.1 hypothetical protein Belba_0520 [Belliella baltica DSM 15883]